MAVGFTVVFSILRVVNFAHGEFYMLGGFSAFFAVEYANLHPTLSLFCAAIAVGVIGFLIEPIVFRPFRKDELSGMVAAIGLSIIILSGAQLLFGSAPRPMPAMAPGVLKIGSLFLPWSKLLSVCFAGIALAGFAAALFLTKTGRAMRAVVQDRQVAALYGIRSDWIYPLGFAMGVGLAAFAGAAMGSMFSVSPFMGTTAILKAFVIVILGGLGSLSGAAMAAIVLGMVESFTSTFWGAAASDLSALVLVLGILILRPQGLRGEIEH